MVAQKVLFLAILVLLPSIALGGSCTCEEEEEEDHNRKEALTYKLAAIASILLASFIGVSLPVLGKRIPALSPENDLFFIIKSFAAGVILATGFVHVLPDAFESLTSPCLSDKPWEFPFAGFVAMLSAIGTLMVDVYATSHYQKSSRSDHIAQIVEVDEQNSMASGALPLHTHATHGHAHGSVVPLKEDPASIQLRYRVVSQVLELGIIVHSVIIGIALGASDSPKTVKPLLSALTFHQFFEGVGLGGCIAQAKFKLRAFTIMAVFFSLTTPAGIGIGIWISKVYDENSPKALIVQGIFNSASAGILIYMALVDLLSADFMNPRMQSNGKLLMGANASLLLGAGGMSVLATWA